MASQAPARRRTQEERRAATRATLLEATIHCLGREGYAGTSISAITQEAGVSRGALLHHFPTKNELIAHTIVYFYRQRLERFKQHLLGADTATLSLEDRLRVLKKDFATWYHTALEIEVAMRTNEEIAAIEQSLAARDHEEMSQEYEQLFPEFVATPFARELVGIACYLMRGLAANENDDKVDRQFEVCASMIRSYLDQVTDPANK
ncbi:MAG: TetR/AcrR family transcriptional regulator [Xanthomonadales bacterium]|nr:TetR/AcrR family transcriptional regulator [Xanthomonadales bacterium]